MRYPSTLPHLAKREIIVAERFVTFRNVLHCIGEGIEMTSIELKHRSQLAK